MTDAFKLMTITTTLSSIFEAIDANGDDAIAADEFQAYFASLGGFLINKKKEI